VSSCHEISFGRSAIFAGLELTSPIAALQESAESTRICHVNRFVRAAFLLVVLFALDSLEHAFAKMEPSYERIFEFTFASTKEYADPFNDVDVDVIFTRGKRTWRVPTFWRGGQKWTVRFAPPTPGDYTYRLESTDKRNIDLNGHARRVTITAYTGNNPLLRHGAPRVSASRRYFEHADGTPFYWLGDTLWTGLSDRLPWSGFQQLVADRKEKGFTVVQICVGLVPYEEEAPVDPGFHNEGGTVWDPAFKQINPNYFDYADRRIRALLDAGIAPALVGGWNRVLSQMGVSKMKKHWRYIIARYGAYPVFWIIGGEVLDPPESVARQFPEPVRSQISPGWTDIVGYVRVIDPYHHPLTVHEAPPPFDIPLQDATLTDFDLPQPSHWGWPSIGNEVMEVNKRYARNDLIKPVVVGEIGYELLGGSNPEEFQRMAFWLGMLNGAAGHTYGSGPTYEVNNPDKPLHRGGQYTFLTWEEGMHLPGSYQVGLSSKLLRQYSWWQIAPHPEWVTPHGTTLLEPHTGPRQFSAADFDFKSIFYDDFTPNEDFLQRPETMVPGGEWKTHGGNFRRPYVAGIPGKLRLIYIPDFGLRAPPPPTVLDLEPGIRYNAYYWEPMLGIKFDLGEVGALAPGRVLLQQSFESGESGDWSEVGAKRAERQQGVMLARGDTLSVVTQTNVRDAAVSVDASSGSSAAVLLRYRDANNYLAAVYSAQDHSLYLVSRTQGKDNRRLGATAVSAVGGQIRLTAEIRANWGAASITDGVNTFATPIVDITDRSPLQPADVSQDRSGAVGLGHFSDGSEQQFHNFEVRESPMHPRDESLDRKLYDANGHYRGVLSGAGWEDWGRNKAILLGAYRPEKPPTNQDWLLVLENKSGQQ